MTAAKDAFVWIINLALMPIAIVYSWLVMSGALGFPAPLVGFLVLAETTLGAWVLTRVMQSPGKAFSYKIWITRTGLGFAALLPTAILIWLVFFGGYLPGQ